jgi:hypothetical protein
MGLHWQIVCEGWFSPVAVARGDGDLTLFGRSGRGELVHQRRDRGRWGPIVSFGVPGGGGIPVDWPLSACSTGADEIQLLARGAEGELLHATVRGAESSGFECIGSPGGLDGAPMGLAGAPAACSREPRRMDVFAVGMAGGLLHAKWDESGFGEFESLGGIEGTAGRSEPVSSAISACNCGTRAMAVLTRGPAGDLRLNWWNGTRWSGFESLGAPQEPDATYPAVQRGVPISSAPVGCGRGATRLDVFVRGPRGDLLHKWWGGTEWSGFESLGMPVSARTGSRIPLTGFSMTCAWDGDHLDVFARGMDGNLHAVSLEPQVSGLTEPPSRTR